MYSEIGSEFWTENRHGGKGIFSFIPFKSNCIYTLCGRSALDITVDDIIRTGHAIKSVYLPSYCCHTMIEPFSKRNIKIRFYDVYAENNQIKIDFDDNNSCDVVFFLDYFGFKTNVLTDVVSRQKSIGKIVIYDATHSFFCKNNDYSCCDYVFASLRKWTGVNFGFCSKREGTFCDYSLKENIAYMDLRNRCFAEKREYIFEGIGDKERFLNGFVEAENMLEEDYELYCADEKSVEFLSTFDADALIKKRRRNAGVLIDMLNPLQNSNFSLIFEKLPDDSVPLFVPIELKGNTRTEVRRALINSKIYCPVHWPVSDLHHGISQKAEKLFINEMSLVCDQRYCEDEMNYISYKLSEAIKEC